MSSEILRHVAAMSICQGNSNVNMSGCDRVALSCGGGVRSIGGYLPTPVRAMEATCASRVCVKAGDSVALKENLEGAIEQHVDVDGLVGPREEGRALGRGQDAAVKGDRVVLGHDPAVLEAQAV